MTEDEARQKWCPFARITVTPDNAPWQGGSLSNRGIWTNGEPGVSCIASHCMAWIETDREAVPTLPDGEPDFKPAGYCGLVRHP